MALSVSSLQLGSLGDLFLRLGKLAFDSSYPTGGETISAVDLRLSRIASFEITGNESGYSFESTVSTDGTSATIKAYQGAGGSSSSVSAGTPAGTISKANLPANVDETKAVVANACTLNNVPCNVTYVYASAGGLTGPLDMVPQTIPPASGQVSVNFEIGELLFNAADAITQVLVTYVKTLQVTTTQTFTGSALAGHSHTSSASANSEIPNATDLSSLNAVEFQATGY